MISRLQAMCGLLDFVLAVWLFPDELLASAVLLLAGCLFFASAAINKKRGR